MSKFVVVAIFKNETTNLREWIDHWIFQGASAFHLYDNQSTDDPLNILLDYTSTTTIYYERVNGENKLQLSVYQAALTTIQAQEENKPEWVLFVDLDEFWYYKHGSIADRLAKVPQTIDALFVQWKIFGPSESGFQPKSLRKELLYRQKNLTSPKYAVRTDSIRPEQVNVHHIEDLSEDRCEHDSTTTFCNHYYGQSIEYWQTIKIPRGFIGADLYVYSCDDVWINGTKDCNVLDTELADQVLAWEAKKN